jgi:hypothetical protein
MIDGLSENASQQDYFNFNIDARRCDSLQVAGGKDEFLECIVWNAFTA